ncbi:MAG TPA: peptidylprolyl isomerase, partial [Arthrobacter sp.]|nr:peptidylprolyl isomerase [Arthrobacter sp.]
MAASSRSAREAKRRVQQMEAKRELRKEQDKRRRRDNILAVSAGTAAVVVALVLQLTVFSSNPTEDEYAAAQAGLTTPSATPSPSPSNADNIPKPETAAGQTFTGELKLNSGTLGVELDGTNAPQAAAVFKSLADQNFYAGLNCHRLTTAETFGVLQCGSKAGDGSSDPSFTWGPLENTPPDNNYPAGT